MKLPNPKLLKKTSAVDYYNWNYEFPIKYIQRFRFKAIINLLGNKVYNRILEIGTGSGIFLFELSKHCKELYACDIHAEMQSIRDLCKNHLIKAKVEQCPMEELKFPDEYFDAIIAISVLEFVNDIEKSFSEVKRVMKPGGVFLTICPQKSVLLDLVLKMYSQSNPDDEFKQSRKLVSFLAEKNFNIKIKRTFPPVLGKLFPVYNYYKLTK